MAINYTETYLRPIRVAAVSLPVVGGDAADGLDVGVVRAVEQANWSAAKRNEVHYNLHFGADGWKGGNEIRTIPMSFVVSGTVEKFLSDIIVSGDCPEVRFGQRVEISLTGTTARLAYSLTDEDSNNHTFNVDIAFGAAGDGSEVTTDIDIAAVGLEFNQWISVSITLSLIGTQNPTEVRNLRCQDVEATGTPYEPVDE